ncbi:hypothetical protein [Aeoliella mucimassa]|uniref:Glycosyl hydrolase family 65 central catalytic domain protein n=1 Tax=Aeoliella mucimassa TaxID=2527972 RepID=A0A518APE2_9BACT|nr:hypothetical protein [Aeoliella mucimassa]QDU56582.1 Glycosyl hydrolase family 65 central catalytic domain protein [Aeoliella mucimassa]
MPHTSRLATFLLLALAAGLLWPATNQAQLIDRQALVSRHRVKLTQAEPRSPLQVGNGEFAFAMDITGLQTFPGTQPSDPPLGTMSQWSWHSFSESKRFDYAQTLRNYEVEGRQVSYATDRTSDAGEAFRANPHRFNLARIALKLQDQSGREAEVTDLTQVDQQLDLWTGEVTSRFQFDGEPVEVRTTVAPTSDTLAFTINSPLVRDGRLQVALAFAYPAGVWGPPVDAESADEQASTRHTTECTPLPHGGYFCRTLDGTQYGVQVASNGTLTTTDQSHRFTISHQSADQLEVVVAFHSAPVEPIQLADFATIQESASDYWQQFWNTGGAIDLSGSTDPRWRELERRIVLSQYLTAIQCSGSMPPQETGLLCNSWYGKAHLEMHWWHAAHFAQWGRVELLERSLGWYEQILPAARRIAERQGYAGFRWPKMTGPAGISSPSDVGELLIWQQPHPIYFAELCYRANPTPETLARYREIVEQTAEFMADYAVFDESQHCYALGPVLIPAQECYEGRSKPGVTNPTFELAYWRWALRTANHWRERLGEPPNQQWEQVASQLARPTVRNGCYTAIGNEPWLRRRDHPSMLAAMGVLPNDGWLEPFIMKQTMFDVESDWDWDTTWGWDYPMMAMTAARVGEPAKAIDYLLMETSKNKYLANGHCWQANRLPAYLPANGGLLSATAMMAAGWDQAPKANDAPGFPHDGGWKVRHDGLERMP